MLALTQKAFGRCLILAMLSGATVGCTTVQLDEEVLFQPKQTVVPSDFPRAGYQLTQVRLPVDGAVLDGWYLDRPDEVATVLYFGGQGFQLVHSGELMTAFASLNVDLVAFDYRGYGKSTGKPGVQRLKSDALEIAAHVSDSLDVPSSRLLVHGHSMGSFLATHVSTERSVAALALESPATDVEHWRATVLPWWIRWMINFESPSSLEGESNLDRIGTIDIPLLVVVGEEDPITPPVLAEAIHERSASGWKKLVLIPAAGHNDVPKHPEFLQAYQALLGALR